MALARGVGEDPKGLSGGGPVEARLGDAHTVRLGRLPRHHVLPAREQKGGKQHAEQPVRLGRPRGQQGRHLVHRLRDGPTLEHTDLAGVRRDENAVGVLSDSGQDQVALLTLAG